MSLEELFKVFIGFLQRQYRIIVLAFLVIMALTITYLITTPPSFTALAKLMIDSRKVQLFQQQSVLGDAPPDPYLVDSQVEVLQSENVALAVRSCVSPKIPNSCGRGPACFPRLRARYWALSTPC